MRVQSRKLLAVLLGLVALGFVVYRAGSMFHIGDFSGAKLLRAVRGARVSYLLLSILAIYVCYALRALRWREFQRHVGKAHFWNIYQMTLAGFAAVFLLGRAGEPVRPLLLARKGKLPVADTFGIYVLERLFDTASTAVIAAIGLLVFTAHAHNGEAASTLETAAKTGGSLLAAGVLGAAALLVYVRLHGSAILERRLKGWLAGHGWRSRLAKIILGFIRGVQTIRTMRDLAAAVIYSAFHWALVLAIYFLVTKSFGGKLEELSLGDVMLVLAFTLVGSVVQLPAVGGGSQALAIFAFTKVFGVESEPAVAAAIVIWLISFAFCSFAGVPILIREGFSLGQLKELAEHEKEVLEKEVTAGSGTATRLGEKLE
jgi:glycosyltransferase 2 family protein